MKQQSTSSCACNSMTASHVASKCLTKLVHHCLFDSASLPDLISLFFTNKTAEKSTNFHYEAAVHATRVCTLMSHDRFNTIWHYLHMQNEELPPHRDPVWKLRWLIMHLTTKYQKQYMPHGQIAIDESMVNFK